MRRGIVLALLTVIAAGCATVEPETVTPFVDYANWRLDRGLNYRILDTDNVIEVPAGFVTDYASVPNSLCLFMPKSGRHSRPAIVHDFLYWSGESVCTKEQADQIMYLAMVEQEVDCTTRNRIHGALETFGHSAWDSNAEARAAGHHRVVPSALLPDWYAGGTSTSEEDPIAGSTWESFRPEVDAYYASHPTLLEPAGVVNVDWDYIAARFEEYQESSKVPWWKFWKKDDCD